MPSRLLASGDGPDPVKKTEPGRSWRFAEMSKISRVAALRREARRGGFRRSALRVMRSVRRYGLRTAVSRAASAGGQFWWHRLDLDSAQTRDLPDGLELRRATLEDLPLYEPLATDVNLNKTSEWLAEGNDLWLATENGRTAFACWIYRQRMPMGEAEGGWLRLPPGVAFLEHPVTLEELRGRGLAPACWSMIAQHLAAEGESTLMTKIGEANEVAQRSMAKVGFQRAQPEDPIVRDFHHQLGR